MTKLILPHNAISPSPGNAGDLTAKIVKASDPPALSKYHSRGYLPHYDAGCGYQLITYRLADALPQVILQPIIDQQSNEQRKRVDIEKQLDSGYGRCILAKPGIASIVIENWYWFNKKHYELIAYVVIPNHVHLLILLLEGISLTRIVHSWKSYTAKAINRYLLKAGEPPAPPGVWQEDYWDRYVRNEEHYYRAIEYIHLNPVKAGICKELHRWPWSSATKKLVT